MKKSIGKNVQNVEQKNQKVEKLIHMEHQQVMKTEHILKNVQVAHIQKQKTVTM